MCLTVADLYRKTVRQELEALGLSVHFVNEWHEYHVDDGEIHCGTNQCPEAKPIHWWRKPPPA